MIRVKLLFLLFGCLQAYQPDGHAPKNRYRNMKNLGGLGSDERALKRLLFESYDSTSRPVLDDNETVEVNVGLSLFHLLDTNEKQQTIRAVYSIRFSWHDEYLVWNSSLPRIHIPVETIWHPDVLIVNSADESQRHYMITNAIVSRDGKVLWMVPHTTTTTCIIDARFYPFDEQRCDIVFMSWTYSGLHLNLTQEIEDAAVIYYSPVNQEWDISFIDVARNSKFYVCCPDPYPDVTFKIHMVRRGLFYVVNIVLPAFLLYFLSLLGFFLPDTEKVNMQTTILLTLVILLVIVSDTMPPTSDRIPVISLVFVGILVLVSVAIVLSVISSYMSSKRFNSEIPAWSRYLSSVIGCRKMRRKLDNTATVNQSSPASRVDRQREWDSFLSALEKLLFYSFLVITMLVVVLIVIVFYANPASNDHRFFKWKSQ